MTYLSTVLADNPNHYWRLAERGGQIMHDIGSAPFHCNTGWFVPGYSGIAADGAAGYFSSNTGMWTGEALNFTPPFSWELWFWETYNNGGTQVLVAHDGTAGSLFAINLLATSVVQCPVGGVTITSAGVTRGHWHHVVLTADAVNANLYVDAIRVGPTATVGASGANKSFNVGAHVAAATNGFNGAICEVATYPAVLTPARVTAHFLAQENNSAPVYLSLGTASLDPTFLTVTQSAANVDAILSSVRKTYVAP